MRKYNVRILSSLVALLLVFLLIFSGCATNAYMKTVTTSAINGTITPNHLVQAGGQVCVDYSPNDHYHLTNIKVTRGYKSSSLREDYSEMEVFEPDINKNLLMWTGNAKIRCNYWIDVIFSPDFYEISTSVANGTITQTEDYEYNTSPTIEYSPAAEHILSGVIVDGMYVDTKAYPDSYTFSNIDKPHTIEVGFELNSFVLGTSIEPDGYGQILVKTAPNAFDDSGYKRDTRVVMIPQPMEGYEFTEWIEIMPGHDGPIPETYKGSAIRGAVFGSVIGEPDSLMLKINTDRYIVAKFQETFYEIMTSVINGTISPQSNLEYGMETVINYEPDAHHHLESVTVDGTSISIDDYPDSYTFDNVTEDHSIKVEFGENIYELEADVDVLERGSLVISPLPNAADETGYIPGTEVMINVLPNPGYEVADWTVSTFDEEYTANTGLETVSVTMHGDVDITANLKKTEYTIETSVVNGTITQSKTVYINSDRTFHYNADENHHLVELRIDGILYNIEEYPNSYTFTDADLLQHHSNLHEIKAVFVQDSIQIETSVTNGTITPSSEHEYGDTTFIAYTPNEDCHLVSVTIDGEAVDLNQYPDMYIFYDLGSNHTADVVYAIDTYTLEAMADPSIGGSISVSIEPNADDGISYNAGTVVTLTAIPGDGYEFDCWNGDTEEGYEGLSIEVTMDGDKTIYACFIFDTTP